STAWFSVSPSGGGGRTGPPPPPPVPPPPPIEPGRVEIGLQWSLFLGRTQPLAWAGGAVKTTRAGVMRAAAVIAAVDVRRRVGVRGDIVRPFLRTVSISRPGRWRRPSRCRSRTGGSSAGRRHRLDLRRGAHQSRR